MKYMTFHSSCSYAGVANMLERYGVDTDDRTIAMEMNLPYLFAYEDGVYMAGPMLQSADWFNLYLRHIGFEMTEREIPIAQVPEHLKQQKTAMLGLKADEDEKHAVVYTGVQDGELVFLNNKWEQDPAPEQLVLTEAELMERIGASAMIATLEPVTPIEVDLSNIIKKSISVMRKNLSDIQEVCGREEMVGVLRSKLNTLFRPLLLDGITMLGLLEEKELAQRFTAVQSSFLTALRQDADVVITLGNYLPVNKLAAAVEKYIQIIERGGCHVLRFQERIQGILSAQEYTPNRYRAAHELHSGSR